ncbi:MAG: pyridoxal-phosphate dependent enzyme [Lawsonibacter sp.]
MGAFKIRGAMNKALSLTPQEGSHGLVCASSGNHAQGVACAAQRLGARAVIVMPTNANPVKLAGVKSFGGRWSWWAPWLPAGGQSWPAGRRRRAW